MVEKLAKKRWKTTAMAVAGLVLAYLQAKGHIGGDEAVLASSILVALGGTANALSYKK